MMNLSLYPKVAMVLVAIGIPSSAIADSTDLSLLPETETEIVTALSPPTSPSGDEKGKFPKGIIRQLPRILNIQFDFNKSEIRPQDYRLLGELGKALQDGHGLASATLEIAAHTDNVGDDKYNLQLSQQRAEAVRDFLVANYGIDGSRLIAKGYGKNKPLYSNVSPAGRAKNRRVEVRRIK